MEEIRTLSCVERHTCWLFNRCDCEVNVAVEETTVSCRKIPHKIVVFDMIKRPLTPDGMFLISCNDPDCKGNSNSCGQFRFHYLESLGIIEGHCDEKNNFVKISINPSKNRISNPVSLIKKAIPGLGV